MSMLARAVNRLPTALQRSACETVSIRQASWLAIPLIRRPWTASGPLQHLTRNASSSSSTRWKSRQGRDSYAKEAKVAGLKSRAAYKLLEINEKHRIFRRGDTVVDLGFAPGSWSQVAVNRTSPGGRVVGIDVIPAQPPRGANALQGNFLSPEIREEVRKFVSDTSKGRVRQRSIISQDSLTEDELEEDSKGIVELEKLSLEQEQAKQGAVEKEKMTQQQLDHLEGRVVDVVLSDMSEPWPLVESSWIKSKVNPYLRMMNTSGIAARDHGGSMVRRITIYDCCG